MVPLLYTLYSTVKVRLSVKAGSGLSHASVAPLRAALGQGRVVGGDSQLAAIMASVATDLSWSCVSDSSDELTT